MLLLQTLQLHQLPIPALHRHQLSMRATLHHHPSIDHVDDIRLLDGAQAMRHRDGGAALRGLVQGRLHNLLRLRVQRAGGFVEEEDLGVAEQGARDGDTLFLASGQQGRFTADWGFESVAGHESVNLRKPFPFPFLFFFFHDRVGRDGRNELTEGT